MSLNFTNEDLITIKTKKTLCASMSALLKKYSFRKIIIKGIHEGALICRAAFYAHFFDKEEFYAKNIVLPDFYAGGIVSYFLWQVKNKFPADVPPMNRCLYEMTHGLQGW